MGQRIGLDVTVDHGGPAWSGGMAYSPGPSGLESVRGARAENGFSGDVLWDMQGGRVSKKPEELVYWEGT
jgi:hypothetical protein